MSENGDGRKKVHDEKRSGRIFEEFIEMVEKEMVQNRRITVRCEDEVKEETKHFLNEFSTEFYDMMIH